MNWEIHKLKISRLIRKEKKVKENSQVRKREIRYGRKLKQILFSWNPRNIEKRENGKETYKKRYRLKTLMSKGRKYYMKESLQITSKIKVKNITFRLIRVKFLKEKDKEKILKPFRKKDITFQGTRAGLKGDYYKKIWEFPSWCSRKESG